MIVCFTKQYQAVPAMAPICRSVGAPLISTRRSTLHTIHKAYPDITTARLRTLWPRGSAGGKWLEQANLIVTGSPNRQLLAAYRAQRCMVFHGTYAFMAQKEIDALRHFDIVCIIGPRMQQALQHADLRAEQVDTGYLPFLDFPARGKNHRNQFLQSQNLDPNNPTILYLPRGKPYGSWDMMAEKLIREVPNRYNLVLRPHPSQSVTARLHDSLGFLRLSILSRKRGNCLIDLASCRLSTLFSVADLVMSDGASSPEEALYYDIPQILIESPRSSPAAIAAMMREKKISEDYIAQLLGIYECGRRTTVNDRDLTATIESALADADAYRPQRESYFKWVFGERSLERQQRFIQSINQRYQSNMQ
ncbi:MAG: hypothetical protein N2Z69_02125 [Methylophilaceae bacterium]|nr:hypothetical protein [Methylophilaceae bacterium]